ncbi:MAG: hypothetical protein ABR512_08500 [Desulfopila sp.]
MSLDKKKVAVLTILYENLQHDQPQLVRSDVIAGNLNLDLPELQQLLKIMDGTGMIESDVDLQHNLITSKGVRWLSRQSTSSQGISEKVREKYLVYR